MSQAPKIIVTTLTAAGMLAAFFVSPSGAGAKTLPSDFVRTANYHLHAGTDITPSMYPQLAEYDLLVFPAEAQVYNRDMFARLRALNPDVIILAYISSKSWNYIWQDSLHAKLRAGIQNDWWLTDPAGHRVSVWPNTEVISGVSPWNEYLPRFMKNDVMSTGLWDGVFYDEFSSNASWINNGNIDIHHDGIKDDPALLDTAWKRGMINMLRLTRELLGPDAIIITNGDSTDELQPYVNGRMFETFPTPWEAGGTWSGVMSNYLRLQTVVGHQPVFVINANTGNTGNNSDYRKVRFSLASTLLGDGFFSFDYGEVNHGALWRYDEDKINLGKPLAGPVNLSAASGDKKVKAGLWRRDFENGTVLVNSTGSPQTAALGGEMEKLRGTQDSRTNDGTVVTSVTIPPTDGLLLTRRIQHVVGASFPNGSYVRVFGSDGTRARNGFFAYEAPFDGSSTVMTKDVDGDGKAEKIVAGKTEVSVYRADGTRRAVFAPYGAAYRQGMTIAVGDLDGDGKAEIVTGAGPGGGPHVRIFSADGRPQGPGFFAYSKNFRGGVNIAVGDVYGTGKMMIIAGAGPTGGPHVRVFTPSGQVLHQFFAYDPNFRGGVNVAAGDLNGDGKAEIVTGAGPGGGPHVRIFSRNGQVWGKGFFAADMSSRSGVRVAVTDVDGDGKAEIATFTTDVLQLSANR